MNGWMVRLACVLALVAPSPARADEAADERDDAAARERARERERLDEQRLYENPEPPTIPRFEADPPGATAELPAIRLSDLFVDGATQADRGLEVTRFVLNGNRSLSDERIAAIVAPFLARPISYSDLEILRDLLQLEYQRGGYVGTRVAFAEEGPVAADHSVTFQVTEMRLGEIFVNTDGSLHEDWVANRLRSDRDETIHVGSLERRVQLLQQDERVRRIAAELVPSKRSGFSDLRVEIQERRKWSLLAAAGNFVSPLIGANGVRLGLRHTNVWNRGHVFEAVHTRAQGLRAGYVRYALPLGSRGTSLELTASGGRAEIVDGVFEALDVDSRVASYGVRVNQTLLETSERALRVSLGAEHRRSKSFLLGEGFGLEDGLVKITVLRFGQQYEQRGVRHGLQLQSTFSLGVDALRATQLDGREADGSFFAWRGSFRFLYELGYLRSQLALRGEVQLTESALPGLERIAVGGQDTVRGYRESALVRDNATIGSVELRVPVWQGLDRRLELVPHVDVGFAWNESRELEDRRLLSAGIGARLLLRKNLAFEVGWAADLKRLDSVEDDDLQDRGVYFGLALRY